MEYDAMPEDPEFSAMLGPLCRELRFPRSRFCLYKFYTARGGNGKTCRNFPSSSLKVRPSLPGECCPGLGRTKREGTG